MNYCKLIYNGIFNNSLLTYSYTDTNLKKGDIYTIPFGRGNKEVLGLIVEIDIVLDRCIDKKKVKGLSKKFEWGLANNYSYVEFIQFVASYYLYPPGKLLFENFPKMLKRPKKLDLDARNKDAKFKFKLTNEQKEVSKSINSKLNGFSKHLIHGITGSGKSIIFFDVINQILINKKSILYLLPEINLTPQFKKNLEDNFNCPIIEYHSAISNSQKFLLWKKLIEEDFTGIILGVRSSIFLPIKNLGIIIVDEEHDNSFKQEDRCPYNTRDIGIKLAHLKNIPIVLGSATPSLESYYKFKFSKKDVDHYYLLDKRYGKAMLPNVTFIDTSLKTKFDESIWPFSNQAIALIKEALDKKEQVLVFLNRLGYASFIQCRACSHQFFCNNCSIPLKMFKNKNILKCNICNSTSKIPKECPHCGNLKLYNKGFGTEKLQEVLSSIFKDSIVKRFDRDELTTFDKLKTRIDEFHSEQIDILIGTQMLSKGHNFKKVNTVVILGIDSMLNYPDFRSMEKVYSQITQVMGRSGRYTNKSEVLIQTIDPMNPIFSKIKNHDFKSFFKDELEIRSTFTYPPFSSLAVIYFSSFDNHLLVSTLKNNKQYIDTILTSFKDIQLFGPRPTQVEKRANQFTQSLLIKSNNINSVLNFIKTFRKNVDHNRKISIKIDIDPINIY